MLLMPFQILGVWFRALLTVALIGGGIALLALWNEHRTVRVVREVELWEDRPDDAPRRVTRVEHVERPLGLDWPTASLAGGVALLAASVLGWSVPMLFRRGGGGGELIPDAPGGHARRLRRPDGTELHVEIHGPEGAPALVLTHGWGCDADEWRYARRELAGRFRLVTWDLPGLGRSSRPPGNDYSLERMAGDLDAVVSLAGGPV